MKNNLPAICYLNLFAKCHLVTFCLSVFLSVGLFLSGSPANAQSTIGITHKPDTSYTSYGAFQKDKKYFPQISLVEKQKFSSITEQDSILYCNVGGDELFLDVFYPTDLLKTKRIAVIMIHGGGWRSGNRSQHHPLAQRLAQMGYVCFTPSYRLSTDALFPAAVYDVKSAIRWVRANATRFNLNEHAIVIAGFSAGGELAAFVGNTNGKEAFDKNDCNKKSSASVDAIIDMDGTLSFVHPESGEGDDSKGLSAATLWFGYPKKANLALWTFASPLTYAGGHSVPTLFINSSVARMHAGRDDYMKILSRYGIYTEKHSFPDSPHSFVLYNPWFEPTFSYIDGFLKKIF